MKKALFVVLLFVMCGCSSHKMTHVDITGIHLSIIALPRQGFAPMRVTFTVKLEGMSEENQKYYCQTEHWEFGDGSVSSDRPDCPPYTSDTTVLREFSVDHLYRQRGTYNAWFKLGDNLITNRVGITVLDNPRGPGR